MDHSIYSCFFQPIEQIDGIGSVRAKKLNNQGFKHLGDLLFHLPKAWVDDRVITPIKQIVPQQEVRIEGRIEQRHSRGFGRKATVFITIVDDEGALLELSFFHANYMMSDARLSEGQRITARGTPSRWGKKWQMTHPDWSALERFEPAWQPKYASIAGFQGKKIGLWVKHALTLIPKASSSPWDTLLSDYPSLLQALHTVHHNQMHAPDSETMKEALLRLQLEELLLYFSIMQEQRKHAEVACVPMPKTQQEQAFIAALAFPLTSGQTQAWAEIGEDLASGRRMHRLLQGDVAKVMLYLRIVTSNIYYKTQVHLKHYFSLNRNANKYGKRNHFRCTSIN